MECQTTDIETRDALQLFTERERRRVMEELVDHPENIVSVEYLADQVAPGPRPSASAPRQDQSVAPLKHSHLPKLDDAGVIEYDWRSGTVRYHPNERVERLLEFIRTELE